MAFFNESILCQQIKLKVSNDEQISIVKISMFQTVLAFGF